VLTTYTRKAAETLFERLKTLLGDLASTVKVGTLHSLAFEIASKSVPGFKLAPPETALALAAKAAGICDLSPKKFQTAVSLHKNQLSEPIDNQRLKTAIDSYQVRLQEQKLWDYDDLIDAALAHTDKGIFQAVLADEFQDFSLAQLKLINALSGKSLLTVIGDPDQSIYGFRGALSDAFDALARERADLTKMDLTVNFRSSPILCQASEVIRPSGGAKRLSFQTEPGEKIGKIQLKDPQTEANWVVSKIVAHLGVTNLGAKGSGSSDREVINNLGFSDIAVIFRLRQQGQFFSVALDAAGLPWQMAGEEEITATDGLDFKADKISLLTMHAAKGLEFKLVFVVGVEKGLCPYQLDDKIDFSEDQRLFYVAVTRAKERLYLTRADSRIIYGHHIFSYDSPFFDSIPKDLTLKYQPWRSAQSIVPKPARLF
jgi:DNA helicase-2/ATP-dependent DNA helicase PcrA